MLGVEYTKEGLKELKYIIIKMKPKATGNIYNTETVGLFLGYRTLMPTNNTKLAETDADGLFLWLYKNKCVYLYNLNHYNVESIEVAITKFGKTTHISSYNDTEVKQKEAIERIELIKEVLKDQNRIKSNELVDMSTYEALPTLFKDDEEKSIPTKPNVIASTGAASRRVPVYNTFSHSSYTTPAKKVVETSVFERTGRYSAREAIIKMKEKIEGMKNNTYLLPKPKKIPADKEKKESDSTKEDHTQAHQCQIGFTPGIEEDIDDASYIYGL